MIIKRVLSAKWWKRAGDLEHAKKLAILYRDRIDWSDVEELAARFEVADLLSNLRNASPEGLTSWNVL